MRAVVVVPALPHSRRALPFRHGSGRQGGVVAACPLLFVGDVGMARFDSPKIFGRDTRRRQRVQKIVDAAASRLVQRPFLRRPSDTAGVLHVVLRARGAAHSSPSSPRVEGALTHHISQGNTLMAAWIAYRTSVE